MMRLFWKILIDENGGTLSITRVTANTLITAAATNGRAAEIEAVVNGDIDATNIEDAAVTAAKLASDAVTTVKITDANVTTAKIADSNITTAKIADANVTAAKLATYAVFTQGDWIISSVTTARTGWTNVSATYSNKFMRINATPLTTGGADTDSITLTTNELPAHTHGFSAFFVTQNTGTSQGANDTHDRNADTTNTNSAGSGAAFTVDTVPVYVTVCIFQKD